MGMDAERVEQQMSELIGAPASGGMAGAPADQIMHVVEESGPSCSSSCRPVAAVDDSILRSAPGGREEMKWGPFSIARVFMHGAQIGWGCTCGLHLNHSDKKGTRCKKQLLYGQAQLTDAACIARLKCWLLSGFVLGASDSMRSDHVRVDARALEPPPDDEMDTMLRNFGYTL